MALPITIKPGRKPAPVSQIVALVEVPALPVVLALPVAVARQARSKDRGQGERLAGDRQALTVALPVAVARQAMPITIKPDWEGKP